MAAIIIWLKIFKIFQKKEKRFNPLFIYVIIHMKKNLRIWYKFSNTKPYNLFVKKNFKVFQVYFSSYDQFKSMCHRCHIVKYRVKWLCLFYYVFRFSFPFPYINVMWLLLLLFCVRVKVLFVSPYVISWPEMCNAFKVIEK